MYERFGKNDIQIEQHVFIGITSEPLENIVLGEGAALRFIAEKDIQSLHIAYGFDKLIEEILFYKKQGKVKSLSGEKGFVVMFISNH